MQKNYRCEICGIKLEQKCHYIAHIKTEKHIDKTKIFWLQLNNNTIEEILVKYPQYKDENIVDKCILIKKIIEDMSYHFNDTNDELTVTNKHSLKDWIHDVHNYLRNSGAGYGMKPLNIFSLFYGLMRLEQYNMLNDFGLDNVKMKFSYLLELSEKSTKDESKFTELSNIIKDDEINILDTLFMLIIFPYLKNLVDKAGFEPTNPEGSDLQSDCFNRSHTCP